MTYYIFGIIMMLFPGIVIMMQSVFKFSCTLVFRIIRCQQIFVVSSLYKYLTTAPYNLPLVSSASSASLNTISHNAAKMVESVVKYTLVALYFHSFCDS